MTVLSKTLKRGKSAIEPTRSRPNSLMPHYEYDRLCFCFILVPVRGKITLGPRPQNKILVPFRET